MSEEVTCQQRRKRGGELSHTNSWSQSMFDLEQEVQKHRSSKDTVISVAGA